MLLNYITQLIGRQLLGWDDNEPWQNWLMLSTSIILVLFAGVMSGLTLGLMSLDMTQMEVGVCRFLCASWHCCQLFNCTR